MNFSRAIKTLGKGTCSFVFNEIDLPSRIPYTTQNICRYRSDEMYDDLALNFVKDVRSNPDITHVYLARLNRGPKVNVSTDCIDGGYPIKGKTDQEISMMDWKMNRKIHHRYNIIYRCQITIIIIFFHLSVDTTKKVPEKI